MRPPSRPSLQQVTSRLTMRAVSWLVIAPGRRRLLCAAGAASALLLLAAAPAVALPGTLPGALTADEPAPTNPWLAFFQPMDSHGFSPWQYELSADQGGATSPGKAVAYFFACQMWMQYRFLVVAVMWLLDFVLQFKQLDLLKAPAEAVSSSVQNVTGQIGVVPMMVTISVVMSGVWLFRGRSGAAAGEIFTTAIISALIGGALANPVAVLTGPDGALPAARDFGVQVSAQLVGGASYAGTGASVPGPQSAEQLRQTIDAKVLDNLIRIPHQLINYGQVLDRTKPESCLAAYNKALGVVDDAGRNAVGDACGKETKDASDNTGAVQLGVMVVSTAGGFFFLLVLALALALLVFTALALWEASKFLVVLIQSLIPGSSRSAMFISFCTAVICVAMCAVTLMAVGLLLLVLDAVFVATAAWPPVTVFLIVDLMLLAGAIVAFVMVFRAKRSGVKMGERVSKAMQPRPSALPNGGGLFNTARQLAQPALQMRQNAKLRQSLAPAYAGGPTGGPGRAGPASTSPAGSSTSQGAGSASRPGALSTVGKAAWTAGQIGLASTVGAPVYAPRAAAAAKKIATARKVAMAAKLQAKGDAVSSRVTQARDDATAFGQEYVHNVAVAGRTVGRATGVPRLLRAADAGRPAPMNGPDAAAARPGTSPAGEPSAGQQPDRSALQQLNHEPQHVPTPATGRKKPPPSAAAVAYTASDRVAQPARTSHTDRPTRPEPPDPPASPISYPQSGADRLRARLRQR